MNTERERKNSENPNLKKNDKPIHTVKPNQILHLVDFSRYSAKISLEIGSIPNRISICTSPHYYILFLLFYSIIRIDSGVVKIIWCNSNN